MLCSVVCCWCNNKNDNVMLCSCKFFYCLDADRPDRRASHHFCADSEEERKEWLKNLKQVLYGSKGGGKNYPESLCFRSSFQIVVTDLHSCFMRDPRAVQSQTF